MRLVIDARESGTSTGRYIDKLLEYLARLDPQFKITVLTKSDRVACLADLAPKFEVIASDYKEFTFAEQLRFLGQIRKLKADLVHFSMIQQPVLYKGKKITTVHDLTTARFSNPSKNWLAFRFKQLVYRWVIRRVAASSKAIITPSRFVKDDLVNFTRINPHKITTIPEAADKISVPPEPVGKLAGKKFIMYVGRPTPHKNLERLIEAFVELKPKHPELKLVLAGKKDVLYERYERRIKERGIDGIIFTGFVSEGQLRWMYQNTAAYIFPSLSEGFGLPGLEAMVHGAPVVSSSATCLPEIYGQAAHYFDPSDSADMSAKIDEVLTDAGLRSELIKKGRARAAKYSWRRMAEQTLEVYKEISEN